MLIERWRVVLKTDQFYFSRWIIKFISNLAFKWSTSHKNTLKSSAKQSKSCKVFIPISPFTGFSYDKSLLWHEYWHTTTYRNLNFGPILYMMVLIPNKLHSKNTVGAFLFSNIWEISLGSTIMHITSGKSKTKLLPSKNTDTSIFN